MDSSSSHCASLVGEDWLLISNAKRDTAKRQQKSEKIQEKEEAIVTGQQV